MTVKSGVLVLQETQKRRRPFYVGCWDTHRQCNRCLSCANTVESGCVESISQNKHFNFLWVLPCCRWSGELYEPFRARYDHNWKKTEGSFRERERERERDKNKKKLAYTKPYDYNMTFDIIVHHLSTWSLSN